MSIYEQNQIAEQIARVFDSHGVRVDDLKKINELVEDLVKEGGATNERMNDECNE